MWWTKNSTDQAVFLKGKIPNPKPEGFYKGSVLGRQTLWKGKKFDPKNSSGINLFNDKEVYPFKTYIGKGLTDDIDVYKIDYNISGNPFWLRFILDEIVEVSPNHYLGKVHLRLIPGLLFSLGYFRLEK